MSLAGEARKLGANSAVYLIPTLLSRGFTLLVTPIYVRVMTTEDYGTVGLATTVGSLWSMLLGLSLVSSFTRLHFECKDKEELRQFNGTILGFLVVFASAATLLAEIGGRVGVLSFFATLPFEPHLRIVLWAALLNVFVPLPIQIYLTREQPFRVAVLNVVATVVQLACAMVFVVWLRQGALGMIRAGLYSAGALGVLSIALVARESSVRFSGALLKKALAYSLPLVPHVVANWVLSISDRIILERNVPRSELGTYTLAYMFALVVTILTSAISNAFSPMVNRQLKDPETAGNVPRLGTYALAGMVAVSLATAALAREAILIATPPAYHDATRFVPWVVLGSALQGLYFVWSVGTWYSMNTKGIPIITAIGGGANIALNLFLVPRYGVAAAAVNTAVAYAILAGLHGWLAHRLHPIAWEYRRWAVLFAAAIATYGACAFAERLPLVAAIGVKILLLAVGFPALLVALRFFTGGELGRLRAVVRARLGRTG